MEPFDHTTLADRLPVSLYGSDPQNPIRTLFRMLGEHANALEANTLSFTDPGSVSGLALDRIGALLGLEREGRSDAIYRNLILSGATSGKRISLDAYNELLSVYGTVQVEELCYDTGADRFFWDGRTALSGKEVMNSRYRPQSLRISLAANLSIATEEVIALVEIIRGLGVQVYFEFQLSDTMPAGHSPDSVELYAGGVLAGSVSSCGDGAGGVLFEMNDGFLPVPDSVATYPVDEIRILEASVTVHTIATPPISVDYNKHYAIAIQV